jgi:hypothetical protein
MVSSEATTVDQYLAELDPARAKDVSTLRDLCKQNLPVGLEEAMNWGMIAYQVPLSVVPDTYNGKPLLFAAIASQKNYISLYLMSIYGFDAARQKFEDSWLATGKKPDVGKSCIRLKSLESVPLDVVRQALTEVSLEEFIARYRDVRGSQRKATK